MPSEGRESRLGRCSPKYRERLPLRPRSSSEGEGEIPPWYRDASLPTNANSLQRSLKFLLAYLIKGLKLLLIFGRNFFFSDFCSVKGGTGIRILLPYQPLWYMSASSEEGTKHFGVFSGFSEGPARSDKLKLMPSNHKARVHDMILLTVYCEVPAKSTKMLLWRNTSSLILPDCDAGFHEASNFVLTHVSGRRFNMFNRLTILRSLTMTASVSSICSEFEDVISSTIFFSAARGMAFIKFDNFGAFPSRCKKTSSRCEAVLYDHPCVREYVAQRDLYGTILRGS
mmetsp:Transcript_14552/g.35351  ORF Transcript_14552/g.35351 Transcript_14552/m.35351 type:complete len:284 (-) Transcript_14552:638-1489(-)